MAVCAPAAAPSTVTHSEIDDDLVLVHKNLPVYIPFNLFIYLHVEYPGRSSDCLQPISVQEYTVDQ